MMGGRSMPKLCFNMGGDMKKIVLLLVAAAFAAAPAAAATKHKKAKPEESVFAKQSANTGRILKNGLPLILPSWLLPVYFGMHKDADKGTKKHTKKTM
jgi:hypothetical protein